MRKVWTVLALSSSAAAYVLPAGIQPVPTAFWLLQAGSEDMSADVALCSKCCGSANAEELEASVAALTATGRVAVECEPITTPDDPQPLKTKTKTAPNPAFLAGATAEELTSFGPRTFLLPGGALARVNEFDFEDGGTGSRVWDAAIAMGIWLARNEELFCGKSVLELGSGTGFSGICAALAGADVTLSDMAANAEATSSTALAGGSATAVSTAALLPNLEANARLNGLPEALASGPLGAARTLALDWEECFGAEPEKTYDVVVGSDVVYEGFAVTALAAAVIANTAPGGVAYLMSASSRFADASAALLVLLEAKGTVELETLTIHNSFGNTELVLTTWTKEEVA
jgi:predicted nicotinamide N-methyase